MIDLNILDEIDLKEKEMLSEKGRVKAAEVLMLDPLSYEALKYELNVEESTPIKRYHGYQVVVSIEHEFEKCIRFI